MNHVAKFRKRALLSQRALAAKVGVSQQTIQRIEAEAVAVRLETAAAIAAALGTTLGTVFPELSLGRTLSRSASPEGIDASGASHSLVLGMRGGLKRRYSVDAQTASRMKTVLSDPAASFVAFDAAEATIIVNTAEVLWSNHQFDPGYLWDDPDGGLPDRMEVAAYFRGEAEPARFAVDPDEGSLAEEDEHGVQLQGLIFELEIGDPGENRALQFLDEDGELVTINTRLLQLMEIPLHAANPRLLEKWREGQEEEDFPLLEEPANE